MDKTLAGLIGAIGALAASAPAHAATGAPMDAAAALHANSYADLLKPIPNALALMKSGVTLLPPATEGEAAVQDVQLTIVLPHRHHHHHHHRYWRRRRYHHHHHHHHHHHILFRLP